MTEAEVEAVRIYFKLTERQREVVRLLLAGVTNYRALCDRMGISETTVRSHVNAAMQATNTHDKVSLVLFVLRRPLLERFFQQGVPE